MAKKIVRFGVETCSYDETVSRFSEMLLGAGYTPDAAACIVLGCAPAHPSDVKWFADLADAMNDLQEER